MNCKPGDLAIVVTSNPQYNGRLVEVLHATPPGSYKLPDGYPARNENTEPCWVLKFIGGPVCAPLVTGGVRQTWYGSGADRALRPLRGDPDAVDQPVEDELTIS